MRPAKTERSNVVLTSEGVRDLPAEKIAIFPPGTDPSEVNGDGGEPGLETVWIPDDGERRAIANGAPIILRVWGEGHPPVALSAGNPTVLRALISKAHIDRAVGYWWKGLAELWTESGKTPEAEDALELWHDALAQTREGPDDPEAGPIDETAVATCRSCGCTESRACVRVEDDRVVESCHWLEEGLCSACGPEALDGWRHPELEESDPAE